MLRRCWSISIDGEAVCVGFATLPYGGGAPTLCTHRYIAEDRHADGNV
jgi:hypothetical protein